MSYLLLADDSGLLYVLTLLYLPTAFDTVSHQILMDRLACIRVRGTVCQWMASCLADRWADTNLPVRVLQSSPGSSSGFNAGATDSIFASTLMTHSSFCPFSPPLLSPPLPQQLVSPRTWQTTSPLHTKKFSQIANFHLRTISRLSPTALHRQSVLLSHHALTTEMWSWQVSPTDVSTDDNWSSTKGLKHDQSLKSKGIS